MDTRKVWCSLEANSVISTVLNEPTAAQYLGLSPAFLRKRRRLGLAPAYSRLGRRVVYQQRDLDALIAAGRIDPARPRR
jgi:hypothetical protein